MMIIILCPVSPLQLLKCRCCVSNFVSFNRNIQRKLIIVNKGHLDQQRIISQGSKIILPPNRGNHSDFWWRVKRVPQIYILKVPESQTKIKFLDLIMHGNCTLLAITYKWSFKMIRNAKVDMYGGPIKGSNQQRVTYQNLNNDGHTNFNVMAEPVPVITSYRDPPEMHWDIWTKRKTN